MNERQRLMTWRRIGVSAVARQVRALTSGSTLDAAGDSPDERRDYQPSQVERWTPPYRTESAERVGESPTRRRDSRPEQLPAMPAIEPFAVPRRTDRWPVVAA